jgi:hypothetical protein
MMSAQPVDVAVASNLWDHETASRAGQLCLLQEADRVPKSMTHFSKQMTDMTMWQSIETAPKDGSLLDVKFDVASAEAHMAEFYAPLSTRAVEPTEPVIENVAFVNGGFKPVIDAEGAREVACLAGGWGTVLGVAYGIVSVTLTHWRPASNPLS